MTPYVIFKGKNLKQEFRDGMPPGTAVSMSKSGYIVVEIFNYFIKHFVSHKPQGNEPNILLLDGHSTHVSDSDTLQYTLDNNVIEIRITPHTFYYIQPLDTSFFRSLKVYYYSAYNSWIKQNPARGITKFQFGMLLSGAWGKAFSVQKWSKCVSGIWTCAIQSWRNS
jgi:hypothetical protein